MPDDTEFDGPQDERMRAEGGAAHRIRKVPVSDTPQFKPVLLGGDANAYGMARSFFEEYGLASDAICKGAFHICRHSRLMDIVCTEPRLEEDEVFVDTLLRYAASRRGERLLLAPCGDNYTKMLVRNQDALRDAFAFCIMAPEVYGLLSTKAGFYGTCLKHGLKFPETCEVDARTAKAFEPPFPYPVIVKPSNSVAYWNCSFPGKKKVFVVNAEDELRRIFQGVYSSGYADELIVQEFIPGDDTRMRVMNCYSDTEGRVRMMCLGDVLLEEHTPEGIGSYGAIMTGADAGISERIKGFLEEIGYVGYSNFDLKFDERDGSYKLFEINPRQGRSSYFCTASGKNLARYLVRDVIEHDNRPLDVATLEDEVLWTMVPLDVIGRYVTDERALARVGRLVAAGKVSTSYWSPDDRSLLRYVSYRVNQRNYRNQYARCFNKRGIDD